MAASDGEFLLLRSALNEKDLELIELREKYMQLIARTDEARDNWEVAMAAKDRAILQLEEVLVLKQQAIDRMLEASTHAAETDLLLQERTAQVNALEKVLGDARGKISSLKTTVTEQKRQLEVANEQLQHRAMDDMRVDQLRKQLTAAFQEELRIAQQRGEMHEQLARGLSADVQRLKELLAQRDKDIQALNDQGTRSKLQIQRLQQELMRPSGGASIDATRGLSTMQTALGEPWREDSRLTMLSDELGGHGRRRPTASTGVAQEDSDMERMYAELDELRRQRQAHVFRRHESAATVPSAPVPVPASPPKINPASPHHTQPALQPMLHPQQLQHEQQQALLEQHAQLHEAAISALKVQVETLNQQLTTVAAKLQVRDAQAKKYKEAVKVLKAQLHTSENALSDRQAKFMELHLELSALNRMLKDAPTPAPALSPQDAAATVAAAAATAAVAEASAEEAAARAAAEIASMSADIASLKQQLVDKDTSIAALRREVADREALRLEAVERAMDAVRRAGAAEEAVAHAAEQLREGLDKVVALETNQQAAVAAAAEAARLNAQLREAQEKIATLEAQQQAAAAATAAAATAAVAAAQQAAARVAEAETVPRRLGDAEAQARDAEARLSDALRQADQAKARQLEAQKRVDESARQLAILEARLDEAERKLADYRRVIERAEQRAERAERCAREAEIQLAEADRRASQAESYANTMERRLRDTEAKVLEVDRHAKEVEARGMELEARLKATETRALEFEKRGLDCESRLAVSERRVRDAESQITELTHRWRETERQKQEADIQARAAEASAKQAKSEKESEVLSITRALEARRSQEQRQLQDLQSMLERMSRMRDSAEARVLELETALRASERLVASLQAGASTDSVRSVYEERVRGLEEAVSNRDRTLTQLRDSLLQADVEYKRSLQALVVEVQAKTAALLEAERRFTELEAVMQRMVARSGTA